MKPSLPYWFLWGIALYDAWHIIDVFRYHYYERPVDRWDFRVFFVARTSNVENISSGRGNGDFPPYSVGGYLHQPFSNARSKLGIYSHVATAAFPSFIGAVQLTDKFRGGETRETVSASHRYLGFVFFTLGTLTSIQGIAMAPTMQWSHFRRLLTFSVVLLGGLTIWSIGLSVYFIRFRGDVTGHRSWALRSWLLMEFFVMYARLVMGVMYVVSDGFVYSFAYGGCLAVATTPILLELIVSWHMSRAGKEYLIFGPLPGDWRRKSKQNIKIS